METLAAVDAYLRKGEYPSGFSKGEKANLRRKCRNNYKLEEGMLYYRKAGAESDWKICVRSEDETRKIMESCHAGIGGKYSRLAIILSYYSIIIIKVAT